MSGNVRWMGHEFGEGQFIVWEGDPVPATWGIAISSPEGQ